MNNLHIETEKAAEAIEVLLSFKKAPICLLTIIKSLPTHREDAVRLAFWHLSREGRITVNKQFRASLPRGVISNE